MTRRILIDDDATQFASIEQRLKRLEQSLPEPLHYVDLMGEPAFQNSWGNVDGAAPAGRAAGFYRFQGRIYLAGIISGGTSNTTAFVLPVGYRPTVSTIGFVAIANTAPGRVTVNSAGAVIPIDVGSSNVNAGVYLNQISFRHV